MLVFGHTHKPWVHEYGGVLFVNCGSVGKPKDGDPRAAFAVLERRARAVDARIERVEYDAEASRARSPAGLPAEFAGSCWPRPDPQRRESDVRDRNGLL